MRLGWEGGCPITAAQPRTLYGVARRKRDERQRQFVLQSESREKKKRLRTGSYTAAGTRKMMRGGNR